MAMTADRCGICQLEADPALLQMCFRCDTFYHLNPYSTVEGIDCGDAIVGDEMGIYYYCGPCLIAMNEEMSVLAAQEMPMPEGERGPGWRAAPPVPGGMGPGAMGMGGIGMDPMAAMMGMMGMPMPGGMGPMGGMPPFAAPPAPRPAAAPSGAPQSGASQSATPKPAARRRRFRRIDG